MKAPDQDLIGGGGISPCLILWRGTFPGWLSLLNGDPDSTQILTRHCSAYHLVNRIKVGTRNDKGLIWSLWNAW
jgi:hypothetical protein